MSEGPTPASTTATTATTTPYRAFPPPFDVKDELNHDLWLEDAAGMPSSSGGVRSAQLRGIANRRGITSVPGQVLLSAHDTGSVTSFLATELLTERLDAMYSVLWLVGTRDSAHISPLHGQVARGRSVVVSEDPGLHLVWYYDRVFVKPLPACLVNHAFWAVYLARDSRLRRAAVGLCRSYARLVQSAADMRVAREHRLLPPGVADDDFYFFIDGFRALPDDHVSLRYHYGDLRLSRLNLWSKLYMAEMFYARVHGQHGQYFARFVPPFVFAFGSLSVGLAAMQVVLAVDGGAGDVFARVSKWYSVVCLMLLVGVMLFFGILWLLMLLRELVFVATGGAKRKSMLERRQSEKLQKELMDQMLAP